MKSHIDVLGTLGTASFVLLMATRLTSTGCTKASPGTPHAPHATEFRSFTCLTPDERGRRLTTATPHDFLSVHRRTEVGPLLIAQVGVPCARAADTKRCLDLFHRAVARHAACDAAERCDGVFALAEKNGHFEEASNPRDLASLFRPIDSEEEAWLIAQSRFLIPGPLCGDPATSAFRQTDDGLEVRYPYPSKACDNGNPEISSMVVGIKLDGLLRLLDSEVISPVSESCQGAP